MQRKSLSIGTVALAVVCGVTQAQEGATSFLQFGELDRQLVGRSKQCEFEFALWDAAEGGERVGRALVFDGWEADRPRLTVKEGWFEVVLDFGIPLSDDAPLYLETRYTCGRGAPWSRIATRETVTDAIIVNTDTEVRLHGFAPRTRTTIVDEEESTAGPIDGHSLDAVDGDPIDVVFVDAEGNVGIGTSTPASTLDVRGDLTVDGPIRINGDNNPLEFHVNGTRALRFEYSDAFSEAPNVIGGSPNNNVVPLTAGAVIAGGGSPTAANQVSEDWGTVSGGRSNHAFGMFGTVSGGSGNTATGEGSTVSGGQSGDALGAHSTVGGGLSNAANGDRSTVAGGTTNTAGGAQSVIGGGELNSAAGAYSTVPGGFANAADADYSFAAGRRAKALHLGSFVWADSTAADFASTAANQFRVRASGGVSLEGNVGIGTTTPGVPLNFADLLGNKISLWGQDGGADHFGFGIQGGTLQMYAPGGTTIAFGHGRSDSFIERMRVHTNGNVGIGTNAPAHALHVVKSPAISEWLARFTHGGANTYLSHGDGFGIHVNTGNQNRSDRYGLQVRNAVGTHLYVRDDGKVGIGTTAPVAKLDLRWSSGVGIFSGNLAPFGTAQFQTNLSSPSTHIWCAENSARVFSVTARGDVVIAGNLHVAGNTTNFIHRGAFTAEKHNSAGVHDVVMTAVSKSFCALTLVDMEDIDAFAERARCQVYSNGASWVLRAQLLQNNDADVICQARCFVWDN